MEIKIKSYKIGGNKFSGKKTDEKQPEVKNVDNIRYLGLWLDRKLSFEVHLKQVTRKASGDIAKLARLITNKFQLAPTTIVRLYLARTRPKIEYGLNLYANSQQTIQKLDKIQNKFIRLAFAAARHNSHRHLTALYHNSTV